MSSDSVFTEVSLYTNFKTARFNVVREGDIFKGSFLAEIVDKKYIYEIGDNFSMTINFTIPCVSDTVTTEDAKKGITISVSDAYCQKKDETILRSIEYELSPVEAALIKEGIAEAFESIPDMRSLVIVDNEDWIVKDDTSAVVDVVQPIQIFISENDSDHIVRYDDSAHGSMVAVIDGKYRFSFDFSALVDEDVTIAKYSGGVCVRERVETLKNIEVCHLKVADEVSHPLNREVVDAETLEPIVQKIDDATKELLKAAIIEEIRATEKS